MLNLKELKDDYKNTLDELHYCLSMCGEDYTGDFAKGYAKCMDDIGAYFKDKFGIEL